MKLLGVFVLWCASFALGGGLPANSSTDMRKPYGPGLRVEPPYWTMHDLTRANAWRVSDLDLTEKQKRVKAYPKAELPTDSALRGRPLGSPGNLVYPNSFTDRGNFQVSQMLDRPRVSTQHLLYSPTNPLSVGSWPSYRHFELSRNAPTVQSRMFESQLYQVR